MKSFKLLSLFIVGLMVVACSGESGEQQAQTEEQAMDDVRTIELIGIDAMKFGVAEKPEDVVVSDTIGQENDLLRVDTIKVEPGEEIRIRLTTRSTLPASAMAHNWVLLTMDADPADFAQAAIQAKANDYIPQDMTDQVIAETGLVAGDDEPSSVTFAAPEEPGAYEYVCTFPGHFTAGMRGTLLVTSGQDEMEAGEEMESEDEDMESEEE